MNKSFIFGALTGAAAGAGITFVAMREYFRAKTDAEVNEVREYYANEYKSLREGNDEVIANAVQAVTEAAEEVKDEEPKSAVQKADEEYERIVERENYSKISEAQKPKKEKKKAPNKPYCVTPEHFNQEPGFSKVTLDYWAGNKVFTNIDGNVEPEAGIWIDFEHNNEFGVYEDELLYVRNDQMNTDFEIMYHEESYEGEEDI